MTSFMQHATEYGTFYIGETTEGTTILHRLRRKSGITNCYEASDGKNVSDGMRDFPHRAIGIAPIGRGHSIRKRKHMRF